MSLYKRLILILIGLISVITLLAPFVNAAESTKDNSGCQDDALEIWDNRYVDLKKMDTDDELKAMILEVRAKVKDNLGFLPDIKRTDLLDVSDIKLYEKGVAKTRKNAIAKSSFRVHGSMLEMEYTEVIDKKKYRRQGLSELMLAEILARHPEVKKIYISNIQETNGDVFF